MRRWIAMTLVISLAYACGGGSPPASTTPVAAKAPEASGTAVVATPPQAAPSSEVHGTIARAELLPILDAGLGRFLQGVQTEPYLVQGRFVGFRLLSLWPTDPRFAHTGLEKGDVIVHVNGQPIEHPEQALEVWNGLRVASALYIEYLRDGQPRALRFAIVD